MLNVPFALRDLVVSGKNLVRNKRNVGAMLVGSIALLTLITTRFPILGPLMRRLEAARQLTTLSWAERKLAQEAMEAAVEAAAEATATTASKNMVRMATGELGDEAQDAFRALSSRIDDVRGPQLFEVVENLKFKCASPCFAPTSVWMTLGRLVQPPKNYPPALVDELVLALSLHMPGPVADDLLEDALEGMLVFMRATDGTQTGAFGRLANTLQDFQDPRSLLTTVADQRDKAQQFFVWVKQASDAGVPGLSDLLLKGPGTLPVYSTTGAYHVMEYIARDLRFVGIEGLEVAAGARFIDIKMTNGVRKELKNLRPDPITGLVRFSDNFAGQIGKDVDDALLRAQAAAVADGRAVASAADKIAELSKLEYVFRGSVPTGEIVQGIRRVMEQHLTDPALRNYISGSANSWLTRNLIFLGRSTPF